MLNLFDPRTSSFRRRTRGQASPMCADDCCTLCMGLAMLPKTGARNTALRSSEQDTPGALQIRVYSIARTIPSASWYMETIFSRLGRLLALGSCRLRNCSMQGTKGLSEQGSSPLRQVKRQLLNKRRFMRSATSLRRWNICRHTAQQCPYQNARSLYFHIERPWTLREFC